MTIQTFTCNPFQTNAYVCHSAGEAVLIDPAPLEAEERRAVTGYLEARDLTLRRVLLTHAHLDHIFSLRFFAERAAEGFLVHRADRPLLQHAEEQARMFGYALEPPPEASGFLQAGDAVTVGEARLEVLHTPGHSPGSISFYSPAHQLVVGGDVLFAGSIGRTDLWQGDLPTLMASIFQSLLPLGDDVRLYPGHGPATTLGKERRTNPFLLEATAGRLRPGA